MSISTENKTQQTAESIRHGNQRKNLEQTAVMLEVALTNDDTDDGVKECLKTIIWEISNEANLALGDLRLIRYAFPNIIEALDFDYGCGVYHSINAILRYNTTVFEDFRTERRDEKPNEVGKIEQTNAPESSVEDLARQLSEILHNDFLPDKIRDVIQDELTFETIDIYTPENIAADLKHKLEVENER